VLFVAEGFEPGDAHDGVEVVRVNAAALKDVVERRT
jgi:hypothetical protein